MTRKRPRSCWISFAESVELALESNGVVTYAPDEGDPFDPRRHRRLRERGKRRPGPGRADRRRARDGYLDIEADSPIVARRSHRVHGREGRRSERPQQGIFGIDLGTTYSVVAYIDETGRPAVTRNSDGDDTTPSVVYFETADNIVVGKTAKECGRLSAPMTSSR